MSSSPVMIEVLLPVGDVRRWQAHVVARLVEDRDLRLRVTAVEAVAPPPVGLDLLFAFERLFVGRDAETAVDRVELPRPEGFAGLADLVIDLAGVAHPPASRLRLTPSCGGARPLEGALTALLDEAVPVLAIELAIGERSRPLARWPVAIEDRRNSLRAASMVAGRMAHLVLAAVDAVRRAEDPDAARLHLAEEMRAPPADRDPGASAMATLFARSLVDRIKAKLTRLAGRHDDWRVVWRFRDPATPALMPGRDGTPFRLLADDGRRFFADPFPLSLGDRTLLFVEELPYATGRGVISLVEIDTDGRVSAPRPVLEQDCHLSYPNVFAHDGRMWMVPETSGRRRVELWVADPFPDAWRLHAVLLDDVDLADATLIESDGRWWMFGSSRERWCSSWDALHVFHAPSLTGPWTPHPVAPAVVDVGSARPGGRMFRLADGWRRPVQDSRAGYGGGLAIAHVLELTPETYRERVESRWPTPAPLRGLHTWNQSAGPTHLFETLDVFVDAARFGSERRLDLSVRTEEGPTG